MRHSFPLLVTGVALVITLAATSAFASGVHFSRIDQNDDEVLSERELIDAFGEDGAARILEKADTDDDNQITTTEARAAYQAHKEEREAAREERLDEVDEAIEEARAARDEALEEGRAARDEAREARRETRDERREERRAAFEERQAEIEESLESDTDDDDS